MESEKHVKGGDVVRLYHPFHDAYVAANATDATLSLQRADGSLSSTMYGRARSLRGRGRASSRGKRGAEAARMLTRAMHLARRCSSGLTREHALRCATQVDHPRRERAVRRPHPPHAQLHLHAPRLPPPHGMLGFKLQVEGRWGQGLRLKGRCSGLGVRGSG
eukprot:3055100-Rhodomonas_salina.4